MTNHEEIDRENRSRDRRIDLFFTPAAVTHERLKGYTAVVIDVLRAAASITYALHNGARDVIPAESPSAVLELAGELQRDDLLICGEKDGKIVEGFHIGNSPSEFSRERVRGRTLIFGTTNGTPAILRASVARSLYICGFINLNQVVDELSKLPELFPLAILCSGKYDSFAIEDAVCGGLLIKRLRKRLRIKPSLNDAAKAAELLHLEFGKDLLALLRSSDHGRYLMQMGMEGDLPLCAADSTLPIVPELQDGRIVVKND